MKRLIVITAVSALMSTAVLADENMVYMDQIGDRNTFESVQIGLDNTIADSRASAIQHGNRNEAYLKQRGSGNRISVAEQIGDSNEIRALQRGYQNRLEYMQVGDANFAEITQRGRQNRTAVFQEGNRNFADIRQSRR
ncbi:hypothetical protein [Pistricoccus aurantiacus]|uniref:hypothetical protein n=1 Tax=Pistricoccus aurantiacus TaxID=1883414 RepID=UPI00363E8327